MTDRFDDEAMRLWAVDSLGNTCEPCKVLKDVSGDHIAARYP
jgi:hypothetical protein